jgi:chromate reductase, NAD(P)H dehydrogenase (quinone)
MNTPTKLLCFAGSARAGSYSRQLASAAAQMSQEFGADVTLLELASLELPMFNQDAEASGGLPAGAQTLKRLLFDHAGWIVVTPEYNGMTTPLLKNAIDWATRPGGVMGEEWKAGTRPFVGKVVGLMSASAGPTGGMTALATLRPLFSRLGCWVTPGQFALGGADKAFDATGALADAKQAAMAKQVVEQAVTGARKLSA